MTKITINEFGRVVSERLQELEKAIATAFINAFLAIGLALTEIRVSKLYKDEFDTFEKYCSEIWQLSKSQAYRYIKAARIYQALEERNVEGKFLLPVAEGTIRPFEDNELSEDQMWECWKEACLSEKGKMPTANTVYRVIDSFLNREVAGTTKSTSSNENQEQSSNQTFSQYLLEKIDEKFDVVLTDQPWPYGQKLKKGINPEDHYPLMTLPEMADMGIEHICKPDCALFMWAPSPKLCDAMFLLREWGFTYTTSLTWIKVTKNGFGKWLRSAPEHLLIAKKGNPRIPDFKDAPAGYYCSKPETPHSKKPAIFHSIVEELTKGMNDRIELFARRTERIGWHYWGNEIGYKKMNKLNTEEDVANWGSVNKSSKNRKKAA